MATKKEQRVNADSLQLPLHLDSDRLETHLEMFGDVLSNSPGNTGQDGAAQTSEFHPQTLLGGAEQAAQAVSPAGLSFCWCLAVQPPPSWWVVLSRPTPGDPNAGQVFRSRLA